MIVDTEESLPATMVLFITATMDVGRSRIQYTKIQLMISTLVILALQSCLPKLSFDHTLSASGVGHLKIQEELSLIKHAIIIVKPH
jgi:hypothetical protein